jgi:hypothetical protein
MLNNRSFSRNFPYVALVLGLVAVSIVMVALAQPVQLSGKVTASDQSHSGVVISRAQQAETARWQAMADAYNKQRAREVEIARWQGMARVYNMRQSGLSRSQLADAARWTAMAIRYELAPENISPSIQYFLGR